MSTGRSEKQITELSLAEREALFQKLKQQKKQQRGSAGSADKNSHAQQPILRQSRNAEQFPASFAQQRLWFLDQYEPESPLYILSETYHIEGPLNLNLLQHSLDMLVGRHETLRTAFRAVNGMPAQVIAAPASVTAPLRLIDLSDMAPAAREALAMQRLIETARQPFDLSKAPLLRMLVIRQRDDDYLLQICFHHIISDGWSFSLFFQELSAAYTALAAGTPPVFSDLPVQYADYAIWQQERQNALDSEVNYWRQQLTGAPALLALPTDHPRPALQTANGARCPFVLSSSLTAALNALSLRTGTTLFMTLLAAYQTLLLRITGEDDIVVGTPIANRARKETAPLIGLFVNTIALRSDLSGDLPFTELLARVREVCLEGYTHQNAPFEQVVERLMPERSLSYAPLFQVFFALQNTPTQPLQLPRMTTATVDFDRQTARFDLSCECWEEAGQLHGFLTYNTDLFDVTSIERLADHFQMLLAGIVAAPETRLSRLPLLNEEEHQHVLTISRQSVVATATKKRQPTNLSLPTLITQQAAKTPQAIAISFAGDAAPVLTLNYGELIERASIVAQQLQRLGVGPETLVGVCLERSPDMIVALLGIWLAGGAYVPLDPDYPAERLAYVMQDASMALLLTQSSLVERLPLNQQTQPVLLETLFTAPVETMPTLAHQATLLPGQLAYVLYTSGSTGKPKGVQIPHRALLNFLWSLQDLLRLTTSDLLLAITSLSFDIAGLELWLPLLAGAQVQIVPRTVTNDGAALRACLDQSGATLMQGTPASWRLMLAAGWQGNPHLRQILCGGEALSNDLAQQLLGCLRVVTERGKKKRQSSHLWNLYGPTETTIWSTVCSVNDEVVIGWVPIGSPIDNTQCYILDTHGQLLPIGVPGELYIGGDGLARGYLGRPDLTAERFIPDPFSLQPGARLYRTGDQARWQQDAKGTRLEYQGRLDTQVKLRGYRIELGEIEAILEQHPQVQAAVAQVRTDTPDDPCLVAYIVPTPTASAEKNAAVFSATDLQHHLRQYLPDYMLPTFFVSLDVFPLTPNGKVDRKVLPAPEQRISQQTIVNDEEALFRTPLEEQIATIWESLLGVQQIRRSDQFFMLGGHSLLATRLMARVKDTFKVDLPVRVLFEAPTFVDFTEAVAKYQQNSQQIVAPGAITVVSRQRAEELLRALLEE